MKEVLACLLGTVNLRPPHHQAGAHAAAARRPVRAPHEIEQPPMLPPPLKGCGYNSDAAELVHTKNMTRLAFVWPLSV